MEKEKITEKIPSARDFNKSYQESIDLLEAQNLSVEKKKEIISSFWQKFEEYLESRNIFVEEEVGEIYKIILQNPQNLLTRREGVKRVMDLLIADKPITISGEEHRGGNAAVPNKEGIQIAMTEGQTNPGIIPLMFFNKDSLKVENCPVDPLRPNRQFCKRATGEIKKEDLKYLVFRIPKQYFPQDQILPEEKEDRFIFRGVVL